MAMLLCQLCPAPLSPQCPGSWPGVQSPLSAQGNAARPARLGHKTQGDARSLQHHKDHGGEDPYDEYQVEPILSAMQLAAQLPCIVHGFRALDPPVGLLTLKFEWRPWRCASCWANMGSRTQCCLDKARSRVQGPREFFECANEQQGKTREWHLRKTNRTRLLESFKTRLAQQLQP